MKKALIGLILCLLLTVPAFAGWTQATLLSAVTSTGASGTVDTYSWSEKTFYVVASSVTTGGTIKIQTSPDNSNWADIAEEDITANGTTEIAVTGMFHRYIRANLSSRTDGTYTVYVILSDN